MWNMTHISCMHMYAHMCIFMCWTRLIHIWDVTHINTTEGGFIEDWKFLGHNVWYI